MSLYFNLISNPRKSASSVSSAFYAILLLLSPYGFAQLQVLETFPAPAAVSAGTDTVLEIRFDRPLDPASVSPASLRLSGALLGTMAFSTEIIDSIATLRLQPAAAFLPGEAVTLRLTTALRGSDGTSLSRPFQLKYQTGASAGDILNHTRRITTISLLSMDEQPARIGLGDFNRDGFVDAAVVNSNSNTLTVLLNIMGQTGIPVLQAVSSQAVGGITPVDLAVADFDDDGNLDIVTANFNSNDLSIFWGLAGGFFALPEVIPTGLRPAGITAEDLNGDGRIDLALALFGDNQIALLQNDGARSFSAAGRLDCRESTYGVAAGDMDGDGDPDLAAINNGDLSVSLFRNQDFQSWQALPPLPLPQRPVALRWGNIRQSTAGSERFPELTVLSAALTLIGKPAAGHAAESRVTVFEYDADSGGLLPVQETVFPGSALDFTLANLDYERSTPPDTDLDLVLSDYPGSFLYLLENAAGGGWEGDFQPLANSAYPRALASADIDRDGDIDILLANHLGNTLGLLLSGPLALDSIGIDTLLAFGDVTVGDTAQIILPYQPDPSLDLQVDVTLDDETNFDVQPRTFAVPAATPQPVTFSFMPADTQAYSTVAALQSNHPVFQQPGIVIMTGRGVLGDIAVSPSALDFGNVPPGEDRTLILTVRNRGNGPLQIGALSSTLAEFTHPSGPDLLAGRERREYPVTFSPLVEGSYADTLWIESDDRDTPRLAVPLRGSSRILPDLLIASLAADRSPVYVDLPLNISAAIENRIAPVTETFRVQLVVDGRTEFDTTVTAMDTGESFPIRRTITLTREGAVPVTVIVDSENSVPEANEDNNRRTLEIPVRPGRLVVRPNPFTPNGDNRNDRAEFDLTQLSLSRPLLKIYDLNGRSIRVLSDISANRLSWDGSDGFGRQALPGVYLYVLQDGNENVAQGQVVLAR